MRINLERADGTKQVIEAEPGLSVMEVLRKEDILDGECNGSLACATCHVWVAEPWGSKLPETTEDEEDMLDVAFHLAPNSRLCCQIIMNEETDGIEVAIPRP